MQKKVITLKAIEITNDNNEVERTQYEVEVIENETIKEQIQAETDLHLALQALLNRIRKTW